MKVNEGFTLELINNVPYILPYGQNIADHKRGVKLNDTGLFLWNELQKVETEKELLEAFAGYCEASSEETKILENDLKQFLDMLRRYDILENASDIIYRIEAQYFRIGGINIKISVPDRRLLEKLGDFIIEKIEEPEFTIEVKIGRPQIVENGELLVRNEELCICSRDDKYILLFPQSEFIREGSLTKDKKFGCLYVSLPYHDGLKEDLFHAIRLLFLYHGQSRGMFAVHSASILYKGKVWIFAGQSGRGKSTHTNLWNEIYDIPLVNGDLNLITIENGKPFVYGMPWCGTSGIYDTETYPLGGIVLVSRSAENQCEELSEDEKALLVMQRMISPTWTKELLESNLAFAMEIGKKVPVCRLKCTKTRKAVEVMKQWIDNLVK